MTDPLPDPNGAPMTDEVKRLREQEALAVELGNLLPEAFLERDRLRGLLEAKEAELEELSERLAAAQITIGQLSHERARLREGLARLEWNRDGRCNGCNGFQWTVGHEPDCWLVAELRTERP